LEPASNKVGAWLAGIVSGGAVPNRSAAKDGETAAVSPAQAREKRTFIGHPRIAKAVARFRIVWRLILNYYLTVTIIYPYNT
jgi:hypothetical protein